MILGNDFGIVIQARLQSTRLPGKVLMDFCHKPLLQYQIDFLKDFNLDINIVVATSTEKADDKIADFCSQYNISCIRGSETNVFNRYCLAAEHYGFKHIIRLTGDNPLTNYKVLKGSIDLHLLENPDLTSTRRIAKNQEITRFVPKGSSIDILNCQTLLSIDDKNLSAFEREHVIPVFFNREYRVSLLKDLDIPWQNLSIDTLEDLQRISEWVLKFNKTNDLMAWLGYMLHVPVDPLRIPLS